MNDDPLSELREEPRPEFAASLARRLQELDEQERAQPEGAHRRFGLMLPLLASGLAAVVATHNADLAARMDRRVTLRDGKLEEMGS